MLASSAPYLAVIDADLQHDETLVPELLDTAAARATPTSSSRAATWRAAAPASWRRRACGSAALASALEPLPLPGPDRSDERVFRGAPRRFLDRVVRRLYGRGFKILLDLIAARARRDAHRRAALPHAQPRSTARASSARAWSPSSSCCCSITLMGRLLPARFFLFAAVGATRRRRAPVRALGRCSPPPGQFLLSQALATWVAMTSNFFLNNVVHLRRPAAARPRDRGAACSASTPPAASARSSISRSPTGCSSSRRPTGSPGSAAR